MILIHKYMLKIRSSFDKIIERFKELQYTSYQLKLFQEAKAGDVFYASMPFTKRELERIPKGHRKRPYLVVGKNKKYLMAYQCSSTIPKSFRSYQYYHYRTAFYKKNKLSYFHLHKIYYIPIKNIIDKWEPLIDTDRSQIKKRIIISNNNGSPSLINIEADIILEIGDIFDYNNQWYYIYQRDNQNIYTYFVVKKHKRKTDVVEIDFIDKVVYIDVTRKEIFASTIHPATIYFVSDQQIINIQEKRKLLKKLKKEKKGNKASKNVRFEYRIGQTLIDDYGESYIYLYSLHGRMYGVFNEMDIKEFPQILKIRKCEYLRVGAKIENMEVRKIVEYLLNRGIDPHGVLNKVVGCQDEVQSVPMYVST